MKIKDVSFAMVYEKKQAIERTPFFHDLPPNYWYFQSGDGDKINNTILTQNHQKKMSKLNIHSKLHNIWLEEWTYS